MRIFNMEDFIKQATSSIASAVETAAAIIIAFGAVEATVAAFIIFFVRRNTPEDTKDTIRLRLGRWLALALEFELAADILRTAIAPTWNEIGQLAAIVVLRTALNYFLQKEIEKAEVRNNGNMQPDITNKKSAIFAWWPQKSQEPPAPPLSNATEKTSNR